MRVTFTITEKGLIAVAVLATVKLGTKVFKVLSQKKGRGIPDPRKVGDKKPVCTINIGKKEPAVDESFLD